MLQSITGCLDTIDLDVPASEAESFVVQGILTKNGDRGVVNIFTNLSSKKLQPTRPVRVKSVLLLNDLEQQISLAESGDGKYSANFTDSDFFKFGTGVSFKCRITTINNVVYESSFKTLNKTPKISNITFKNNTDASISYADIFISVDLSDLKTENRIFKWDILQSYKFTEQLEGFDPGRTCYCTSPVEILSVPLYDARKLNTNVIGDFLVSKRKIDYHFSEGYYSTVVQQTIDIETYNYFLAYNDLVVREGNIFEVPAGKIPSNIKCTSAPEKLATGYFYVVEQDTARVFIDPVVAGSPGRQCPMPPGELNPCPTRACCDCLTLKGASLFKPHFWN